MSYCGVPTRGADGGSMPRYGNALRSIADEAVGSVYEHGSGKASDSKYTSERHEKAKRFREKYGSDLDGAANVLPYYIGVFDTVAALGSAGLFRWALTTALTLILIGLATIAAFVLSLVPGIDFLQAAILIALASTAVAVGIYLNENFKSIRDFPKKGDFSWHLVSWRLKFYNTFLNKRVKYARHAMAIDENRENFPRVRWDVEGDLVRYPHGEPEWLKQVWFAGNHSDIGGSYPEDESRLSDIALRWMIDEGLSVPDGIRISSDKLCLHPSAGGMQHCEVSSMRDSYWRWVPNRLRRVWPVKLREVMKQAPLHPTVVERFKLPAIYKYGIKQKYRPENLRDHELVREHFPAVDSS